MKRIAIAAAFPTLAGCETMRTVAPHTTSGFAAGGVLGAFDGASGGARPGRTMDGQVLRVAVDDLALGTGTTAAVDDIRVRRQQACALIGAVRVIADEAAAPLADVTIHDAAEAQGLGAGNGNGAVLPEG